MTPNRKQTKNHGGFSIPLQPDTDLGLAMLIAEEEEGRYQPIAVVSTLGEGKEIAASDFANRMGRLERGEDPGLCPHEYKISARGVEGYYLTAGSFPASIL
jgi:hypothetical protein